MNFYELMELLEARGEPSFDLKFWFWGKDKDKYGLGYARRKLIQRGEAGLLTWAKKGDESELEDKKMEINMKRLETMVDLFSSPIVLFFIDKKKFDTLKRIGLIGKAKGPVKDENEDEEDEEKNTKDMLNVLDIKIVNIKAKIRDGDVTITDDDGKKKHIDVIELYQDATTRQAITTSKAGGPVINFSDLEINDEGGDTLNTLYAKFVKGTFHTGKEHKDLKRSLARTEGLETAMKSLRAKNENGIEVMPFTDSDYKLLPENYSSKKFLEPERKGNLGDFIRENAEKLEKAAKERFSK
jgi:hypothetical protein